MYEHVAYFFREDPQWQKTLADRRLTLVALPSQFVKHLPLCLSDMANIIHVLSVSAKIPQADRLLCGPQGLSVIMNITLGLFTCLHMAINKKERKLAK